MSIKTDLIAEMKRNEHIVQIIPCEFITAEWHRVRSIARVAANVASPLLDSVTASQIMRELGYSGKVVVKNYKGKAYVIFKGMAGARKIFCGTRYLATNPKVVRMAIGPKGVLKSVKGGAVVTIVLFCAVDIADYFLRDNVTLYAMLGTLTSDLAQVGISALIGAIAGGAAMGVSILGMGAASPLIIAVGFGILTGLTLTYIDERTGATKGLIEFYDKIGIDLETTWDVIKAIPSEIAREISQWEQYKINQTIMGKIYGY